MTDTKHLVELPGYWQANEKPYHEGSCTQHDETTSEKSEIYCDSQTAKGANYYTNSSHVRLEHIKQRVTETSKGRDAQQNDKQTTFYGTGNTITAFTNVCHWTL
jgi:hypothetical protein